MHSSEIRLKVSKVLLFTQFMEMSKRAECGSECAYLPSWYKMKGLIRKFLLKILANLLNMFCRSDDPWRPKLYQSFAFWCKLNMEWFSFNGINERLWMNLNETEMFGEIKNQWESLIFSEYFRRKVKKNIIRCKDSDNSPQWELSQNYFSPCVLNLLKLSIISIAKCFFYID